MSSGERTPYEILAVRVGMMAEALCGNANATHAEIRAGIEALKLEDERHEHDMDALRGRLVEEHEGSPARVDAELWERQCHEAEMERDRLRDWLRWRSEWSGAPSPTNAKGTAWFLCALRGDAAPSLVVEPKEKQ